ncbi:COG2426 family protein [Candidatus Omnitrophota bacterium]
MIETILQLLNGLPKEIITVIVAGLPIAELRGALPLALLTFKIPLVQAFWLAYFGNLLPVLPLLLFLGPLSERLRHFRIWRVFFDRLFERTKKRAGLVERYEALGLILFVAIPLPVTGAWTGCIAAALFKIRLRYAFCAISIGVFCAGIIVSLITLIGRGIFHQLFLMR